VGKERVWQILDRAATLLRDAGEKAKDAADLARIDRLSSAAERAEDALWYAELALELLREALEALGVKPEKGGERGG
jgi:hypothetical protein